MSKIKAFLNEEVDELSRPIAFDDSGQVYVDVGGDWFTLDDYPVDLKIVRSK